MKAQTHFKKENTNPFLITSCTPLLKVITFSQYESCVSHVVISQLVLFEHVSQDGFTYTCEIGDFVELVGTELVGTVFVPVKEDCVTVEVEETFVVKDVFTWSINDDGIEEDLVCPVLIVSGLLEAFAVSIKLVNMRNI